MGRKETVELTNMCMVRSRDGRYLVEDRVDPNWSGLVFPGGHVEKGESFTESVVREVREETGITVCDPRLCGVKQFYTDEGVRYIVFLYRATAWEGSLSSSDEGEAMWLTMDEIRSRKCVPGFEDFLTIFLDDDISELLYRETEAGRQPLFL